MFYRLLTFPSEFDRQTLSEDASNNKVEVPTIAAVNGHCFAGGMVVALSCDYRVMTDGVKRRAWMCMNEVNSHDISFHLVITHRNTVSGTLWCAMAGCDCIYHQGQGVEPAGAAKDWAGGISFYWGRGFASWFCGRPCAGRRHRRRNQESSRAW
jgi:hypothetical protein